MKYTTAVLAAATLAQAAPYAPVCKVVTQVVTGEPVWVTADPSSWSAWSDPTTSKTPVASSTESWGAWDPSSSKTPVASSTNSWSAWDPASSTKSTASASSTASEWSAWESWTSSSSVSATSTTTKKGGDFYPSSTSTSTSTTSEGPHYTTSSTTSAATTTTGATTTSSASSSITTTTSASSSSTTTAAATTTTSSAQGPKATCSAADGKTFQPSGSCGSSFTTHCGARVSQDTISAVFAAGGNVKFWERVSGETIESLDACQAICNDNDQCTAAIWTDDSTAGSSDYKHCWQTNGLPQPDSQGYGQISYKGASSGSCSASYSAQG